MIKKIWLYIQWKYDCATRPVGRIDTTFEEWLHEKRAVAWWEGVKKIDESINE